MAPGFGGCLPTEVGGGRVVGSRAGEERKWGGGAARGERGEERRGEQREQAVRADDGPGLRGLLADDDVEGRADRQRDRERDDVDVVLAQVEQVEQRADHGGDGRLGDGAEAERGERYAELAAR